LPLTIPPGLLINGSLVRVQSGEPVELAPLIWSIPIELFSSFTTIINTIKNIFSSTLKRLGYKIVKIDEYKEETVKMKMNVVTQPSYPTSESSTEAILSLYST